MHRLNDILQHRIDPFSFISFLQHTYSLKTAEGAVSFPSPPLFVWLAFGSVELFRQCCVDVMGRVVRGERERERQGDNFSEEPSTTQNTQNANTTTTDTSNTPLYTPLLPHIVAILPCSRLSDSQMAGPWATHVTALPPHLQHRPLHFGVEVFYTTTGDVQRHVISVGAGVDDEGRWRSELLEQVMVMM